MRTTTTAALLLLAGGCAAPSTGSKAPDFAATDSGGNTVSLATYSDSVLILDFWAVW